MRCEMGGTIETALRLSRKMLTVDAGLMDRNPGCSMSGMEWSTCATGRCRPHRAEDLITKLADVEYRGLDHACEDWERAVEQIAGERRSPTSCAAGSATAPPATSANRFSWCTGATAATASRRSSTP